ncbi:MAG: hypothetical protein V3V13_04440 [Paracoccaceae bacterium]
MEDILNPELVQVLWLALLITGISMGVDLIFRRKISIRSAALVGFIAATVSFILGW